MAKLYLKFDQSLLKEFSLSQGVITIGRLPDNLVQIDNLAVSGHHAKIYWDTDHYVVEDNSSLNGTYVNEQRIGKAALKDGDKVLVGKHTLEFVDEWHEDNPAEAIQAQPAAPAMSGMNATVVLDTKKAKEMLAAAKAAAAAPAAPPAATAPAATAPAAPPAPVNAPATASRASAGAGTTVGAGAGPTGTMMTPAPVLKERSGVLTVLEGKTDEPQYVLSGKLTVIGKSDMASIKLKGWFAPNVAAVVSKRDNKYFIAPQDKGAKVKVNGADVAGQKEISDGDAVEVAGVKMSFGYEG